MAAHDYDIRIISHPLCPFAHRLAVLLEAKGWRRGEDYRVTYLDLAKLPAWFFEMSPGGDMPVLEVGGTTATVNTDRAAEFLDELGAPRLAAATPLSRLRHREAVARVSDLLMHLKGVFTAKETAALSSATDDLFGGLAVAAPALAPSGSFYDGSFGIVDAAYAPFFFLATYYPALRDDARWDETPALRDWGRALLETRAVVAAACPEPAAEFRKFFALNSSAFAAHTEAA